MPSIASFPDVLGYLTDGVRAPVGVVQVALATRPAVVTAGDAFEVVLLVQNAADSRVDVSAVVQLPRGFSGQNTRFIAGIAAGEVGIISLPVVAQPDLNPGSYKLGVEVDAKPLKKAERLREASGGGRFKPASIRADKAQQIEALKALQFSTNKRLARNVLETPVEVRTGSGKASPFSAEAGWQSLWTMADLPDTRVLLHYYGDLMRVKVIPQLRREYTLTPLTEATSARFAAAGFPLNQAEALLIAKVMALVLEYAAPKAHQLSPLAAGVFDLTPFFSDGGDIHQMPRWARALLRLIARDERTALHVVPVLTHMVYNDLLRDAISLSFSLVETATGEDVGSDDEMREYADRIIEAIRLQSGMSLMLAYMPLLLGGIIINEQIKTEDVNFIHLLREQWTLLDQRRAEDDEQGAAVLELAEHLIERALQTYGFRRGST
jgi:hypothetical protein